MIQVCVIFFVSLILLNPCDQFALAALHSLSPNLDADDRQSDSEQFPENSDSQSIDGLIVSPPSAQTTSPEKVEQYYFPYKQSMSPFLGLVIGSNLEVNTSLGILYQIPSNSSYHWEIGATMASDGGGDFLFLYKRIFQKTAKLRPYYSLGFDLKAVAQEGLPTFVNLTNWGLAAFIGTEEVFSSPMSWRVDLGLMASRTQAAIILRMGYSWAW